MASSGINKQSTWRSADAAILGISLERGAAELLSVQLAGTLRRLILEGRIGPGTKLPASRQLARELSVSRATVIAAVDQLVAEGYAEGRRGSGLYVAPDLPESLLQATPPGPALRIDAVRPAPELIVPFQPSWRAAAMGVSAPALTSLLRGKARPAGPDSRLCGIPRDHDRAGDGSLGGGVGDLTWRMSPWGH